MGDPLPHVKDFRGLNVQAAPVICRLFICCVIMIEKHFFKEPIRCFTYTQPCALYMKNHVYCIAFNGRDQKCFVGFTAIKLNFNFESTGFARYSLSTIL